MKLNLGLLIKVKKNIDDLVVHLRLGDNGPNIHTPFEWYKKAIEDNEIEFNKLFLITDGSDSEDAKKFKSYYDAEIPSSVNVKTNQDWKKFANDFLVNKLGLYHSFPTTQIEHYDHLASLFDSMKRINTIIIDLNRDLWTYISMEYFKQKIKKGEVGSSAMPHKVNPIDFENSEGNLGVANAILQHLSSKLPISRLQRDLTDSTVLRNIGVPYSHTIIAFKATLKGLDKLLINESKISSDLDENWAVVAEAIQTILRREGYPNPYEALKGLTRTNSKISSNSILEFINSLDVKDNIKEELKKITPTNYTGI